MTEKIILGETVVSVETPPFGWKKLGEACRKSEAEMIASVFVEILRLAVACEWAIEDKRVVSEAIGKALEPHIESLGLTSGKPDEYKNEEEGRIKCTI